MRSWQWRNGLLRGAAATLVLGGLLALHPANGDPVALAAYRSDLLDRAAEAGRALDRLQVGLEPALDEARRGAAATVAGNGMPGAHFEAAARLLEQARPAVSKTVAALSAVRGQLAIEGGDGRSPELLLSAGDLSTIAAQLRDAAEPADAFAEMRRSTRGVLDHLQAALTALRAADETAAGTALAAGDAALADVRRWPGKLVTLPLWISAADRLLDALHEVLEARRVHDPSREAEALAAYRAATEDATRADRALAIALAEGGGGVSQVPLSRLADALAKIEAARDSLVLVGQAQ